MPTLFNLRFATLAVAIPFSIIAGSLISGCGGGGSGGGPNPPSGGALPFFDDFSASSLNTRNWGVYGSNQELQRTRFGSTPQLMTEDGVSFARIKLDTYNPSAPGTFRGTEIYTKSRFPRGEGLEIEARLRGPITQPGMVFAFFTIYDRYEGATIPENYYKSEIDFEFLTAEQERFSPPGQTKRLYLNIWDDWNEQRDGYDGDDIETPSRLHDDKTYGLSMDASFDWKDWNTYKIRWYPDRTEFWLNDVLQRTEVQVLPEDDMSVHFNIWSGDSSFEQAYSSSFNPVTSSGQNQSYAFDVDYVRVRSLATTITKVGALKPYQIPVGGKSLRNR
jgi:hypothetical protein